MTVVFLPMPPSSNRLWRRGPHGMHASADYRQWKDNAAWDIKSFTFPMIEVPCAVEIIAVQKHKLRDLDNVIKPILDALQLGGLIKNDNQVRSLSAKWCEPEKLTMMQRDVRVEVYEL
jgi:Holliday junction resolvase RusA-like endonuclease